MSLELILLLGFDQRRDICGKPEKAIWHALPLERQLDGPELSLAALCVLDRFFGRYLPARRQDPLIDLNELTCDGPGMQRIVVSAQDFR